MFFPATGPLALVPVLLGLLLFGVAAWQVAVDGSLVGADRWLLAVVRHTAARHPGPGPAAQFLCDLGNAVIAVPVLAAAVALACRCGRRAGLPRWWLPPLAAVIAMAAVPLIVGLTKAALARPAPGKRHLAPGGYPGFFPSGHAAAAAVACGAAALLLLPYLGRAAARWLLFGAVVPLNLAVGASLVWCGYHWPLDVVASWCLCAVLLGTAAPPMRRAARPTA